MNFAERNRIFLAKLQKLPESKKKIILWSIVAILAIIMGFFWVRGALNAFSEITNKIQNTQIPTIEFSNMPTIDISETTTPSDAIIK